jgi:hypothetical protein
MKPVENLAVAEATEEDEVTRDPTRGKNGKMEAFLMGRRRSVVSNAANQVISPVNVGPRRRQPKTTWPRRRSLH